jgi:hypothetical protein
LSITTTDSRVEHTGTGSDPQEYAAPFVFWLSSELLVRHIHTIAAGSAGRDTLAEGVDYTVAGGDGATGAVTVTPVIETDEILTIDRVLPLTQAFDFDGDGVFPSANAQTTADKCTALLQQIQDRQSNAIDVSAGGDIECPIGTVTELQANLVGVPITHSTRFNLWCTFDVEMQVVAGVGLGSAIDFRLHIGTDGDSGDTALTANIPFVPEGEPNITYSLSVDFLNVFLSSSQQWTLSVQPRFASCTVKSTSEVLIEEHVEQT